MSGSKDQQVNIAQWIANAIADTGCTVVFGAFSFSVNERFCSQKYLFGLAEFHSFYSI
jgi:hypothetical protein